MLTGLFVLSLFAFQVVRNEERPGMWGWLGQSMSFGADAQEKVITNRWAVLGLALLSVAGLTIGYLIPHLGKWLLALSVLTSVTVLLAISDWTMSRIERSLGQLVRSPETRRYSQLMLGITLMLFWAYLLFPTSNVWVRFIDTTSLGLMYLVGLWGALKAIFHSLRDTVPTKGEDLASFVTAILGTVLHHFVTVALLSLGFLAYWNKLLPGTLQGAGGSAPNFLLLVNYTVGKLTVAGSSLVTPSSSTAGILIDTLFSLLGPGFMALGVASIFTLSSRSEPEKQEPQ